MKVELPNGWAQIKSRKEISERVFRRIDRAETKTVHVSASLLERGYAPSDESKVFQNIKIATGLSDEEFDVMDRYQTELILGLASSWSFESEIGEESLLELSRDDFEALALACQTEFKGTEVDTDPDPNP